MKTTLELPDDLVKRVKIRAIHERKKLKEAIAELIERGMNEPSPAKIPKPLKLRRGFVPTAKDIEAAIAEGREIPHRHAAHHDRAVGLEHLDAALLAVVVAINLQQQVATGTGRKEDVVLVEQRLLDGNGGRAKQTARRRRRTAPTVK